MTAPTPPAAPRTYEVTYDTYTSAGPLQVTKTVQADGIDLDEEFVRLYRRREDGLVFAVDRNRFVTIALVAPAAPPATA